MEGSKMYFLPEAPSGQAPTAEDLENAVDITEALVVRDRLLVAPRAVRRACAKQGHQRKGGWDQCAECGAAL